VRTTVIFVPLFMSVTLRPAAEGSSRTVVARMTSYTPGSAAPRTGGVCEGGALTERAVDPGATGARFDAARPASRVAALNR
jgi:hypothetical protein